MAGLHSSIRAGRALARITADDSVTTSIKQTAFDNQPVQYWRADGVCLHVLHVDGTHIVTDEHAISDCVGFPELPTLEA